MKKRLIVITGQTATGKTSLAVKLAKKEGGELINCDSRQAYKYLDVVTGKDKQIMKKVPIWLYDIIDPQKYFSSFQYAEHAQQTIDDVLTREKTPIIVGGTYFYLKHLLYGIDRYGEPDWTLRKKLDKTSVAKMQDMLNAVAPKILKSMNESDRANPRRLMRRIELARVKKETKASLQPLSKLFTIEMIGLRFKSEKNLKKQITKRVYQRIKGGAVKEVEKLLKKGYSEKDPGLKTIGAKQIIDFIKGRINEKKMIEEWIVKEIQYAKRQYDFMKKDKNIKWRFVD